LTERLERVRGRFARGPVNHEAAEPIRRRGGRVGGSADGVVAAFAGRRFPLRAYGGVWAGQLRWGRLSHARVLGVLKNPC
jgi:hypothetical protein